MICSLSETWELRIEEAHQHIRDFDRLAETTTERELYDQMFALVAGCRLQIERGPLRDPGRSPAVCALLVLVEEAVRSRNTGREGQGHELGFGVMHACGSARRWQRGQSASEHEHPHQREQFQQPPGRRRG